MADGLVTFACMNDHVTVEQSDKTWRLFAFKHRNLDSNIDAIMYTGETIAYAEQHVGLQRPTEHKKIFQEQYYHAQEIIS